MRAVWSVNCTVIRLTVYQQICTLTVFFFFDLLFRGLVKEHQRQNVMVFWLTLIAGELQGIRELKNIIVELIKLAFF